MVERKESALGKITNMVVFGTMRQYPSEVYVATADGEYGIFVIGGEDREGMYKRNLRE